MAVTVTITGPDGKVYTDPSQVKITREDFPEFYRVLENYRPKKQKVETANAGVHGQPMPVVQQSEKHCTTKKVQQNKA